MVNDSIYFDSRKKDLFIDITVNEGGQYYFGDITWEGNELFSKQELESLIDFERGDTYSLEKLQKAVSRLVVDANQLDLVFSQRHQESQGDN